MNIIGCLDVPTSGSYKINNVEVGKMNKDQLAELRCKNVRVHFSTLQSFDQSERRRKRSAAGHLLGTERKRPQQTGGSASETA